MISFSCNYGNRFYLLFIVYYTITIYSKNECRNQTEKRKLYSLKMGSNKRNAFEKENESNTFLYAYKNPMYRRANSEFLTKKLRFELDRPLRPKDYCTKRLLSPISFSKLKKKHVQSGKPSRKKS